MYTTFFVPNHGSSNQLLISAISTDFRNGLSSFSRSPPLRSIYPFFFSLNDFREARCRVSLMNCAVSVTALPMMKSYCPERDSALAVTVVTLFRPASVATAEARRLVGAEYKSARADIRKRAKLERGKIASAYFAAVVESDDGETLDAVTAAKIRSQLRREIYGNMGRSKGKRKGHR